MATLLENLKKNLDLKPNTTYRDRANKLNWGPQCTSCIKVRCRRRKGILRDKWVCEGLSPYDDQLILNKKLELEKKIKSGRILRFRVSDPEEFYYVRTFKECRDAGF